MNQMHDPYQVYPNIFKESPLEKTWRNSPVNVPNIQDGNDQIIFPHEYRSKLKDNIVVMVNVYLKLYDSLNFPFEKSLMIIFLIAEMLMTKAIAHIKLFLIQ